jgi:hypothetical protein
MLASAASAAPIAFSGGIYSQDFDGLPMAGSTVFVPPPDGPYDINGVLGTTGMEGWTMDNQSAPGPASNPNTEFRAQDGSLGGNTGRGVISFGTTGSSERALGELPTSNQIGRFGVAFTNNSGRNLDQFKLSFTGEQWRRGDVLVPIPPQNALPFSYLVTMNPAANINSAGFINFGSFSSPNTQVAPTEVALDGNAPGNRVAVSATATNINWAPGATLIVRWSAAQDSGQDDGLAIDDLSFSIPEPASWVTALVAAASLILRRRRG